MRAATSSKVARKRPMDTGESTRATTLRVRLWWGGSASRMMLGLRHGVSVWKLARPTPALEQNTSGCDRMRCTSSWRATASTP